MANLPAPDEPSATDPASPFESLQNAYRPRRATPPVRKASAAAAPRRSAPPPAPKALRTKPKPVPKAAATPKPAPKAAAKPSVMPRPKRRRVKVAADTGTTTGFAWTLRTLVVLAAVGLTIALAHGLSGTGKEPEAGSVDGQQDPVLPSPVVPTTVSPTPTPTPTPAETTEPEKTADPGGGNDNGGGGNDNSGGGNDGGGGETRRPTSDPTTQEPTGDPDCPAPICFVPPGGGGGNGYGPEPEDTYTPGPGPTSTEPRLCSVDPVSGQVWCS